MSTTYPFHYTQPFIKRRELASESHTLVSENIRYTYFEVFKFWFPCWPFVFHITSVCCVKNQHKRHIFIYIWVVCVLCTVCSLVFFFDLVAHFFSYHNHWNCIVIWDKQWFSKSDLLPNSEPCCRKCRLSGVYLFPSDSVAFIISW